MTGNSITIPASENGLAGTYAYTRGFNVDGSLGYVNMPAAANLPAEQYSYQRDATNLAKNLTGSSAIVASSARDGFGRLTQYNLQALDAGTTVSATYQTGLGRLETYRVDRDNVAAPDIDATYTYNPSGNITSIADVPDPANPARTDRQCFTYDWAGNLEEAWANGATACATTPSYVNSGAAPYWTSWTYDAAHRRTSQVQHSAGGTTDTTKTYTYPSVTAVPNGTTGGPHAATSVTTKVGAAAGTTATIAYDNAGNTRSTPLPEGGTGTISWDQLGRYSSMTKAGATGSTSHVYDAAGTLLIRNDPSGKKTLFLGGDTEITHTPAAGATPAATTARRVFTFEGKIVAFRDGPNPGDVTFQPPGYQGTSLMQTDGAGGSYAIRRFDPFGAPRGAGSGAPFDTQHGFLGATGATTDTTSGLVHLGAREYDPTLGRFLSVDPIMDLTDPQQWNAYGYSNNSPITNSDPTGLKFCADDACHPSQDWVDSNGGYHEGNPYVDDPYKPGNQAKTPPGSAPKPSKPTQTDNAGDQRERQRLAAQAAAAEAERKANRAAAVTAQARPRQSWSFFPSWEDFGFGGADLVGDSGEVLSHDIVRVSGYTTASGAVADPYVRWRAKSYTSPLGNLFRVSGLSAKWADKISGSARGVGKASIIVGAISAGYETYEHDSFYDADPARRVSGFAKARHAFTSATLTAGFGVGGGLTGGYLGASAGAAWFKHPAGAAIGQPVGMLLGGYTGGRVGSRIAIEINSAY